MASHPHLHASLGSYQSFRPNIQQPASASRVSSNPSPNSEDKSDHKHKSRRHHHHHSSHERHSRHNSSRRHAKEVVQSAIQLQPPTSFGDLLKQARGSKEPTPNHSRKGSVSQVNVDGVAEGKEDGQAGTATPPRKPPRPEEVELEGKRVQARERDLRVALQSLSDQSLKTSRRLDDTYYSILEKVSVLRQTIGTLQELSGLTKELHENFESDTKDLMHDVRGQFNNFDNFDTQQQQIIGLEERIKGGQEKADALTRRLTKAKERVDARAKAESEWKSTSTRRLRYFWAILTFATAIVFALILFHHFKPIHVSHGSEVIHDFVARIPAEKELLQDITQSAITSPSQSTSNINVSHKTKSTTKSANDNRLRVFDEL